MNGLFDLRGALRRVRRLADLSQRELARNASIPPSTLAHAEAGTRDLPVQSMARAAAVAGLRLVLLDHSGSEVASMSDTAVTDVSGRRFPAHLDTSRSDAGTQLYEPRRDRPETSFTYRRDRGPRDDRRRVAGTPSDHHPALPEDSPACRRVARRLDAARERAAERERRLLAGEFARLPDSFECACPAVCDELEDWSARPVHADACPCRCDVG